MANKTLSTCVSFDADTVAKLATLNLALIQLWNIVKALIDERLRLQSEIKKLNMLFLAAITYLNKKLSATSLNLVQKESFEKGVTTTEEKIKNNEDLLRKLGISPVSINYSLVEICASLKAKGFATTSDLARQLVIRVCGSYSSFFQLKKNNDPRARIPRKKTPEHKDWVVMSWSRFKVKGNILTLPLPEKQKLEIHIPQSLLDRIGTQKPCYVFLTKIIQDERWKLDIVVSYDAPIPPENLLKIRAIDLGAGNVAVTNSDGSQYLIPTRRGEKYWMDRIHSVEKRMKNRTKGSRGHKSLAKARRSMHNKASAQHKDYQRKLAHALCKDVDCIVVGKTRTRMGLSRSKKLSPEQHHGVQNTGYMLRLMIYIREKCVERGIRYIELPDPNRIGKITDPEAKFEASGKLLATVLKQQGLSHPERFFVGKFWFNQGGERD